MLTTLGVNVVNMAIGLATGIITARVLGPADRGILVAALVWFGTVSGFSMLGVDEGIVYAAKGHAQTAFRLVAQTRRAAIAQGAIGAAALTLIAGISFFADLSRPLLPTLMLALAVPMLNVSMTMQAALRASASFGLWNAIRLIPQVGYFIGLLVLLLSDRLTVASGILVFAGSIAVGLVAGALVIHGRAMSDATNHEVEAVRSFGRRLFFALVPMQLNQRAAQLYLGVAAGPAALGIYAIAFSIAGVVQALGATADQLLFPRLAARTITSKQLVSLTWRAMGVLSVPLLLLGLFAPILINFLYGTAFIAATTPLRILLGVALLSVVGNFLAAELKARGDTRGVLVAHSAALAVASTSLPLLVWQADLIGAAWATALTYATSTGLLMYLVTRTGSGIHQNPDGDCLIKDGGRNA